jgi:hypothetical protein
MQKGGQRLAQRKREKRAFPTGLAGVVQVGVWGLACRDTKNVDQSLDADNRSPAVLVLIVQAQASKQCRVHPASQASTGLDTLVRARLSFNGNQSPP